MSKYIYIYMPGQAGWRKFRKGEGYKEKGEPIGTMPGRLVRPLTASSYWDDRVDVSWNGYPQIIRLRLGFSTINHPAIGVPPYMETSTPGFPKIFPLRWSRPRGRQPRPGEIQAASNLARTEAFKSHIYTSSTAQVGGGSSKIGNL